MENKRRVSWRAKRDDQAGRGSTRHEQNREELAGLKEACPPALHKYGQRRAIGVE